MRGVVGRLGRDVMPSVQAFMDRGEDFVVRDDLRALVRGMNELVGNHALDYDVVRQEVLDRDAQVTSGAGKDTQLTGCAAPGCCRVAP